MSDSADSTFVLNVHRDAREILHELSATKQHKAVAEWHRLTATLTPMAGIQFVQPKSTQLEALLDAALVRCEPGATPRHYIPRSLAYASRAQKRNRAGFTPEPRP